MTLRPNRFQIALALVCAVPLLAAMPAARADLAPATNPSTPTVETIEAVSAPPDVTLHLKDVPGSAIFEELSKITKISIGPAPTGRPQSLQLDLATPASVDIDHQPFWEAVRAVCAATNTEPVSYFGPDAPLIRITSKLQNGSNWTHMPYCATGQVTFVVSNESRTDSISFLDPTQISHEFTVSIVAYVDPRMRVLRQNGNPLNFTEATDDKGNSLIGDGMNGPTIIGTARQQGQIRMTTNLFYPPNPGTRISTFKGSIKFQVQSKTAIVTFPDLQHVDGQSVKAGGMTLTVSPMQQPVNANTWQIPIVIQTTGAPAIARDRVVQSQLMQSVRQSAMIFDSTGHSIRANLSSMSTAATETRMTLSTTVANGSGTPAKLIVEVPVETRDAEAAFEFKDLPIP